MLTIGYAVCGSFCTHAASLQVLEQLVTLYEVIPIVSGVAYTTDTRFGKATELVKKLETLCQHSVISSITEAEPLGPAVSLDAMVIAPCTGNTMAKLAHGITDTPVTMAAKAHMRTSRPLLIALASNDALSANLSNIGTLLNRKGVYFVPMVQDDPKRKPHSLVADFVKIPTCLEYALEGKQSRPIFLESRAL